MNSSYIKAVLTANYRFGKQCHLMATECGRYNADFLAIINNKLIEIEIKTSKADLNNDFKKPKHRIYASGNSYWTPNEFYFAVPEELVEYAVAKCVGKKYGVIRIIKSGDRVKKSCYLAKTMDEDKKIAKLKRIYEEVDDIEVVDVLFSNDRMIKFTCIDYSPWKERSRIVKRAKKLHDRVPNIKVEKIIIARLSSEMANLRSSEYTLKERMNENKAN